MVSTTLLQFLLLLGSPAGEGAAGSPALPAPETVEAAPAPGAKAEPGETAPVAPAGTTTMSGETTTMSGETRAARGEPTGTISTSGGTTSPRPSPQVLPLVRLSGTTAPAGELVVSPSVLVGLGKRVDLQLSPIFKASTKGGKATINLAEPASGGTWAAGGGVVVHVLHPNNGNLGDCGRQPDSAICAVKTLAIAKCDEILKVEKGGNGKFACGKDSKSEKDKAYCEVRGAIGDGHNVDPESLCDAGAQLYDAVKDPKSFQRRYPLAQIYVGALFGHNKYEFVDEVDAELSTLEKREQSRYSTSALLGVTSVTNAGKPTLPLTVEFALSYRSKAISSTTPVRWCVGSGAFTIDGASVPAESCSESVLGAPTPSQTLKAGLFLGGTDITAERWRFSVGPEVSYDFVTRNRGVALKIPVTLRLTPSTEGRGYLGDYKGLIRLTPSLGVDYDASAAAVGPKVLLSIDLLGQQDLFGALLAGL